MSKQCRQKEQERPHLKLGLNGVSLKDPVHSLLLGGLLFQLGLRIVGPELFGNLSPGFTGQHQTTVASAWD